MHEYTSILLGRMSARQREGPCGPKIIGVQNSSYFSSFRKETSSNFNLGIYRTMIPHKIAIAERLPAHTGSNVVIGG